MGYHHVFSKNIGELWVLMFVWQFALFLLLQESNFTYIALIPKVKGPQDPTQLRPITLCNVVYKISSKVLANRLKVMLPAIISPLQSPFVPGRMISDNTLVASEVAHFMRNFTKKDRWLFFFKVRH